MSNDEKSSTTTAPAPDNIVLNNKEAEEKEVAVNEVVTKTEASSTENNGKTAQQVTEPAAVDGKEAATPPAPAAPKPPKPTVHKIDFEKDVVYLYQFSRTKNTPSPSPFCLKVETWLRMAGIKYEVKYMFTIYLCIEKKTRCLSRHCPLQWLTLVRHVCVCNGNPLDDRITDSWNRSPSNALFCSSEDAAICLYVCLGL